MDGESKITYTPDLLNFRFEVAHIFYRMGYHLPMSMFQYLEVRLLMSRLTAVDLSSSSIIALP